MSIDSVMPSNHLILCCPLLLPSIFPSVRIFSNGLALHIKWPEYWSFNFSINPYNEYSGLISFKIVWLDLLAVQGTLKSLQQHHGLKTLILCHSALLMVQLSHPYTVKSHGGSEVKASASNGGDLDSIPGLGRSPGEGNGNPLQYSCLENPMDGGAW